MSGGNLCRIVNAKHYKRVQALTNDAVEKGATVAIGGNYDDSENYIDPTILNDVSVDSKIMHEEIFGPIMPLIGFSSLENIHIGLGIVIGYIIFLRWF